MKMGELSRWNSSNTAMWPDLVVVLFPDRGRIPCLLQCFKPAFIEMFIPKLTVETLDVAVLHGASRLNQNVTDAMRLRPRHEHSAGELRPVIRSHHIWVAPERSCPVQQPGYVFT